MDIYIYICTDDAHVRDVCSHIDSGKSQRDFLLSCLKNRHLLEAHMDSNNMHLDPDELVITKSTFALYVIRELAIAVNWDDTKFRYVNVVGAIL